jgi:PKD repeat protein
LSLFALSAVLFSCSPKDDISDVGPAPVASFSVDKSNPNYVKLTNTATGTFLQKWDFGNGQFSTEKSPVAYYPFEGEYLVKLIVTSKGGMATSQQKVVVATSDPAVCLDTMFTRLTGGCAATNGKTWVLDTAKGAMGVGQPDGNSDNWFSSPSNNFNLSNVNDPCIYDNEFNFVLKGAIFTNNNKGTSLYNWEWANKERGQHQGQYADTCLTYTHKTSNWSMVRDSGKYWLSLTNNEFMAYYEGRSKYQIMKLTDTELYIRAYFGYNVNTGWRYLRFVPKKK